MYFVRVPSCFAILIFHNKEIGRKILSNPFIILKTSNKSALTLLVSKVVIFSILSIFSILFLVKIVAKDVGYKTINTTQWCHNFFVVNIQSKQAYLTYMMLCMFG